MDGARTRFPRRRASLLVRVGLGIERDFCTWCGAAIPERCLVRLVVYHNDPRGHRACSHVTRPSRVCSRWIGELVLDETIWW
jgi:hypothetical protein